MRISDWSSDVCSSDLQHLSLALDALPFEEAAQQLAVVELDSELADGELFERGVDHRRDLGVEAGGQRVLADHVDVALVELAEAAALGALAAVHALHLVAAERERQVVLVQIGRESCRARECQYV